MTPTTRIMELATPKEGLMIRLWSRREAGSEMHDLGLEARKIAADIIARETKSRRAMVVFALVLSLALGAVLMVLGHPGPGA